MDFINSDRLIELIRARQTIYDRNDGHHHNRYVVDTLWAEIAKDMKCETIILKRKWKCLRDHFRIEVNRLERQNKRENNKCGKLITSSWRYFPKMQFLVKHMQKRPPAKAKKVRSSVESILNGIKIKSKLEQRTGCVDFKVMNEPGSPEDVLMSENNTATDSMDSSDLTYSCHSKTEETASIQIDSDASLDHLMEAGTLQINMSTTLSKHANVQEAVSTVIDLNVSLDNIKSEVEAEPHAVDLNISLDDVKLEFESNHGDAEEASSTTDFEKLNDMRQLKPQRGAQHLDGPSTSKSVALCSNDDAEDNAFFQTMLPHLRELSAEKKFKCRMDLQKVIYDYVYGGKTGD